VRDLKFLNDNRKYLFVVAILILAGFCFYFNHAFKAQEQALIKQMAYEKRQDVALLCGVVDMLVEMETETGDPREYTDALIFAVQYIEANFHLTFAQVFDEDFNALVPLSPGAGGGAKHNPLDYPEFVEAVTSNESGDLVYTYENPQAGKREVYMTFRWVPTDTEASSRYLIAVGISKYTISESIDSLTIYGAVVLIIVAAIFIMGCTSMIVYLGYFYGQREGADKWRGRCSDV